ncbi:dienelactone hydrolase [Thermocatellispora tengchongensis]|uniref:Dienelactone hydrolase n=1 Tax=Thermocatellispora tengchongensis TaxID=1073253 RepID=A0A840NUD2_9ACTN|nr:alpha/beta family hydrolase [Thermocatellispora tengchongensis]MBB5130862.1 dienelactone hydrolase [Thermocatellispora tengchongensis]
MNAPATAVRLPAGGVVLDADVTVPAGAYATVVFAHGSGSGRHSPRNRYVASELARAGLATVLADLLTAEEDRIDLETAEFRFDIDRLAHRVAALTDWAGGGDRVEGPMGVGGPVGLFGASTGAAAALVAAAEEPSPVRAVVSRGGRPDLAGAALRRVRAPVLLIVGENDPVVLELNRAAMRKLPGETRLEIVPGATHLFEEPGALERVAELAAGWFRDHLGGPPRE